MSARMHVVVGRFSIGYDGKYQIEYRDNVDGEEYAFRAAREFAKFLFNACSAHDDLVAALREVVSEASEVIYGDGPPSAELAYSVIERASAVLAKATP
jgi:uncharacterized lipoprotein YmbA